MDTCPACYVPLAFHTDHECIATLVEAARPFVRMHRSQCNAAHTDVDVLVKVSWDEWERLSKLVARCERGKKKDEHAAIL